MSDTAEVARKSNRGSKPGEHRGGRQAGTPNKMTKAIKEMILEALEKAGGVDYLLAQSTSNPTAFLTLVGKVLPLQLTGEGGGPVQFEKITREFVQPRHDPLPAKQTA